MEEQRFKKELDESFQYIVARRHDGYKAVSVLLISWEDTDEAEISDELEQLYNLFNDRFGFAVLKYSIPSDRPELNLQKTICDVTLGFQAPRESLVIAYYAGHGDANPTERKAIWAAKSRDGPILNWYNVQRCLLNFEGDVLMILDCCYALLAAREHGSSVHELLAASGLYERTPPAGRYSFTLRLIETINRMLGHEAPITVETIHTSLLRLEKREMLQTTPTRLLLQGQGESIELRPIQNQRNLGSKVNFNDQPLALLSLNIFLSKQFDNNAMRKLQRWLKTHVPNNISAITVDRIILRTEQIQSFLQGRGSLQTAISNDLEPTDRAETILIQSPPVNKDEVLESGSVEMERARMTLEKLEEWSDHVYRSLESNLMLNPSFYSESAMQQLQGDSWAKQLGLSEAAKIRLLSLKLEDEEEEDLHDSSSALPIDYIQTRATEKQEGACQRAKDGVFYIEHHEYGSPFVKKEHIFQQVTKLSKLLKLAPEAMISTLDYDGYIDNPQNDRFELVFRTHVKYPINENPFISLEKAYTSEKFVALDARCLIAIALAKTLSSLHAVGWLHKSFRPEKIIFLQNESGSGYNLLKPFVLGFDISRSTSQKSEGTREFTRTRQIYTHPNRWGRPHEPFSPIHDIYSLGVILLEIGCWRQASQFDREKRNFINVNDEEKIRDRLIEVAKTHLLQMTGRKYSAAVISCLDGTFRDEAQDATNPLRLHKAFTSQVLDVLEKIKFGL